MRLRRNPRLEGEEKGLRVREREEGEGRRGKGRKGEEVRMEV